MDILHAHQGQRCQHQDADTTTKIASINGNQELSERDTNDSRLRYMRLLSEVTAHVAF